MLKRIVAMSMCLLVAGLIGGCTRRVTDFTIITTKNVDLAQLGTHQRGPRTRGEDLVHIIIIIPTGQPSVKDAIDRAIESVPGAEALVDGVIYTSNWWAILYGQSKVIVEGTPLINPARAAQYSGKRLVTSYDEAQQRYTTRSVTKDEYAAIKAANAL